MRVAVVLILLLGFPQDPAERVRALVEKLGSDEIAAREQAAAELVKLGPAAIPAIRAQLAKTDGERKARLEAVVKKIERDDKVAKLLAPGPTVTLKAKDRPAAEVIAEIQKQTGIPIDGHDIPAGTLLSLDAKEMSPAAAIDDLCARHGRLMYRWSPSRVRIRPARYRKLPAFDAGPYRFIADGILWRAFSGEGGGDPDFSLKGVLIGPPGRLPHAVRLEIAATEDDKGNIIGATGPRESSNYGDLEWSGANPSAIRLSRIVWRPTRSPPDMEAAKLKNLRGSVRLTLVLDGKRIATVRNLDRRESATEGRTTLTVHGCRRQGQTLTVPYVVSEEEVESEEGAKPWAPTWIALHDAEGHRLEGSEEVISRLGLSSAGGITDQVEGILTFTLPDQFVPATLDLMQVTDVEEVRLPFDLGEVPLR